MLYYLPLVVSCDQHFPWPPTRYPWLPCSLLDLLKCDFYPPPISSAISINKFTVTYCIPFTLDPYNANSLTLSPTLFSAYAIHVAFFEQFATSSCHASLPPSPTTNNSPFNITSDNTKLCYIPSNFLNFSLLFLLSFASAHVILSFLLPLSSNSQSLFPRSLWGTDSSRLSAALWGNLSRLHACCLPRIRFPEFTEQFMVAIATGWKQGSACLETTQLGPCDPGNNPQAPHDTCPWFLLGLLHEGKADLQWQDQCCTLPQEFPILKSYLATSHPHLPDKEPRGRENNRQQILAVGNMCLPKLMWRSEPLNLC